MGLSSIASRESLPDDLGWLAMTLLALFFKRNLIKAQSEEVHVYDFDANQITPFRFEFFPFFLLEVV